MEYIKDKNREELFYWTEKRIKQRRSTIIKGAKGTGKTEFLKQIKKLYPEAVNVISRNSISGLLGQMCKETEIKHHKKDSYMRRLCGNPVIALISEAEYLRRDFYKDLKILIDHDNVFILTARTEKKALESGDVIEGCPLIESIKDGFPDLNDRFMKLTSEFIAVEDYVANLPDFEQDAVEHLHVSAHKHDKSMRFVSDIVDDCREYIADNGLEKVTFEIVDELMGYLE